MVQRIETSGMEDEVRAGLNQESPRPSNEDLSGKLQRLTRKKYQRGSRKTHNQQDSERWERLADYESQFRLD